MAPKRSLICNWGQQSAHSGAVTYLIVTAGGIEGIGATGKQSLIIAWDQHFDVVVTFILSGGDKLSVIAKQ